MTKTIKFLKTMVIVLSVLGVGLGGFIAYNYSDLLRNPAKAFNRNSGFEYVDENGNVYRLNDGVITFMIYGLDSDTARQSRNEGYRTDVMMAVVVDTKTNQASLVSIPRDTRAQVQQLDSKGKVTKTITTKLNAAFAYGGGPDADGYENSLDAINRIFDTDSIKVDPFEYYVGMDMDDFVVISNALGGVEVTLQENVPTVGSKGETVTISGDRAREYVTYRPDSDLSRTERQRDFIKACAKKLKSDNPVKTVPKLYKEFMENDSMKTNMNTEQITALAYALTKVDLDSMEFVMMPGQAQTIGGVSYFVVDEDELVSLIKKLFYFETDETGTTSAKKTTTEKSTASFTTKNTTAKTAGTTARQTSATTTDNQTQSTATVAPTPPPDTEAPVTTTAAPTTNDQGGNADGSDGQ